MANFVVIEKLTREMQFKKIMQVKIIPFFEPKKLAGPDHWGNFMVKKTW